MKKALAIIFILIFLVSVASCTQKESNGISYDVNDYRTTMKYHDDFKILQITDLHFGIECDLESQLGMLKSSIDEAQPDLIILTGDNFMYANKSIVYALVSTLNEKCKELTSTRGLLTKFAITFGNHDNQGDYDRYFINETILSFTTTDGMEIEHSKYGAFIDYENDNIFGLTNYFIDLVDENDTNDVKYRIHIIDSNTYYNVGFGYKYDVIHQDQLEHAKNIYKKATEDKDYIGLAFFHIPFAEYQDAYDQYLNSENGANLGQGIYNEHVLSPYINNGSYQSLKEANIVSFFAGHDHINYGDFIYTDENGDNAILSYGVKSTNQLYHDTEMIGYKTITLKDNITKEEFVSIEYIKENFINVTERYNYYE